MIRLYLDFLTFGSAFPPRGNAISLQWLITCSHPELPWVTSQGRLTAVTNIPSLAGLRQYIFIFCSYQDPGHSGGAGDGVIVSLRHSKAQEGNPYESRFEITADPLSRRGRNKTE